MKKKLLTSLLAGLLLLNAVPVAAISQDATPPLKETSDTLQTTPENDQATDLATEVPTEVSTTENAEPIEQPPAPVAPVAPASPAKKTGSTASRSLTL